MFLLLNKANKIFKKYCKPDKGYQQKQKTIKTLKLLVYHSCISTPVSSPASATISMLLLMTLLKSYLWELPPLGLHPIPLPSWNHAGKSYPHEPACSHPCETQKYSVVNTSRVHLSPQDKRAHVTISASLLLPAGTQF